MKTNSNKLKLESKNLKNRFKTLNEAQKWIESVEKFGEKYDLVRMKNACKMLHHPEKTFKSIHIGGTNGKGSTLQYIHQTLLEADVKVGTFTSPYVVDFNERITFNGAMISNADLLYYINKIYWVQETYRNEYQEQITFFELVTLISFLYFKDKAVDLVLYEVGLGGTLDATNVITPILSIIVSIGYDHMGVLGNTLESIANNKLGIVKEGVPLISGITQDSLIPQFETHCKKVNAPLYLTNQIPLKQLKVGQVSTFSYDNTPYTITMQGQHQINNVKVALKALDILQHDFGYHIPKEAVQTGLKRASMPGRFETINGVILDGAHNINGVKAALSTLNTLYPNAHKTLIFTVMADKDYGPMLDELTQSANQIVFTEIPYFRSAKADVLYSESKHPNKVSEPNYINALNHINVSPNHITLITGSLYFISVVRRHLTYNSKNL